MENTAELLREYLESGSEEAFATIVSGHLGLVYGTALRRADGNSDAARDIAQTVFTDLAAKARSLPPNTILSGWLYRHTSFVAAKALRAERRRIKREQEAALMHHTDGPAAWSEALPLLDDALNSLRPNDRDAIVLRFLQQHDLRSVGQAIGSTEDAAQKRISRALERLRAFFTKRGVPISTAALVAGLTAEGAVAIPLLAPAVASAALAAAPAVTTSTLIALLFMGKLKTTLVAVVITGAVSVPLVLQQQTISQLRDENTRLRENVPAELAVSVPAPSNAPHTSDLELARLRAEVSALRRETQELARVRSGVMRPAAPPAPLPSVRIPPAMPNHIPSETWADAGLATPEATLQTIGWSIRNGDTVKFKETVHFTEAAREVLNGFLSKMPPEALAEVRQRGWGFEEALLLPAMAQDKEQTYTAFKIISQEAIGEDELRVQTEIETAAGKTHKRPMRFRRIGDSWKQFYDAADVQAMK